MSNAIDGDLHEIIHMMLQRRGPSLIGYGELQCAIEKDCAYLIRTYVDAAPDPGSKKQRITEILSQVATAGGVRGEKEFIEAISGLDPYKPDRILDFLLAEGGDLEDTSIDGHTVLQRCITTGHGPCCGSTIQRLISRGANITVHTKDNQSVLHLAAAFKNPGALSVLLKSCRGRLSFNAYDTYGFTPLHYAVEAGDSGMILGLLHEGADDHLRTKSGLSILHIAAMNHSGIRLAPVSALQGLLSVQHLANLDVNIRCPQGRTPLHCAAAAKDLDAMRELVLAGADLDAADLTGTTALQMSARLVPLVQQALDAGHDVTRKIHQNKTLWHLLTLLHKRAKICKRIAELAALDPEHMPRVASDHTHCLQQLAEIEKRLHDEFSGYDMTQHLQDAQDIAHCNEFDYTELETYSFVATMKSTYEHLWTGMSARHM
ncbi:hypothetical protein G7Y79_00031g065370 [Physcia stellaris]|nr:hypothetical protein G7Y79_00031g065370 [Physcia stellaris]